jgi:hypothetical protein
MATTANGDDDTAAAAADAFLTALESKLREPFSSVEVPKALNYGSNNKEERATALRLLRRVLSRAQKVTQLRVLAGFLSLAYVDNVNDDDDEDDDEWVRVIAGIVQGVLYDDNGDNDDGHHRYNNNRGGEATRVLDTTCRDIIDQVRTVQKNTAVVDEDGDFLLTQDDIDPNFCPYWQSLFHKPIMIENIHQYHHHFVVNEMAEILHEDDQIEEAKSKEEAAHDQNRNHVVASSATATAARPNGATKPATVDFPGFRSTSSSATAKKSAVVQRPKSSLFITSKKPVMPLGRSALGVARGGAKAGGATSAAATADNAAKTLIRKRKPGAAQALLAKGRSSKSGVSRMKMIDVTESKTKLEEQQQIEMQSSSKLGGNKKRAMMMPSSPDAHNKKSKIGGVAGAAGAIQMEPPAEETTAAPPSSPQRKVEDWRKILSEHCNKITDADRERVRQFFEDRINPDGDTMSNNNNNVYRLKLHEEQSVESGRTVKVTYYLNLDYSNFTSKQTKKRKEYNNK